MRINVSETNASASIRSVTIVANRRNISIPSLVVTQLLKRYARAFRLKN